MNCQCIECVGYLPEPTEKEWAAYQEQRITALERQVAELEQVISEHGADMWAQGEEYAVLSAKCAQAQIKAGTLEQQVAALKEERDDCVSDRESYIRHIGASEALLAASQAREAKLREAAQRLYNRTENTDVQLGILLTLPVDDSALMERLKEERERVALWLIKCGHPKPAIDAIRGLA